MSLILLIYMYIVLFIAAMSAGAVEYTDCSSAEW